MVAARLTTSTVGRVVAVTGTDTGVGKTVLATALAARARERGLRVATMKPIETGVFASDNTAASDAERLLAASGATVPLNVVRPYVFEEPLAPFVAAARAGVDIDLAVLDQAFALLANTHDLVIVEGAGGLMVPITEQVSFLQLFLHWQCDVVIAADNRLGVINHTLLTLQVARMSGLQLKAVVLTSTRDGAEGVAEVTNYEALRRLTHPTPVYSFPWTDQTDDFRTLAACAKESGLDLLLFNDSP